MLKNYFKLFRVLQWIKNSFVFVPLVFSRHLFDINYLFPVVAGFILFCLSSSTVYILNDIVDIEADRAHPQKKNRPLPSGKISVKTAKTVLAVCVVIIIGSLTFFNFYFGAVIISFLLLNMLYSFRFKHIVLLDVFSIAAGFMLRVISGAVVINVEISSWLILTTMFISLFLGVMKRRSELAHYAELENFTSRKVLSQYSPTFTDQMATIAAAGVIICYALYTVSERTVNIFHTDKLIYTTPFVVFGIFRYMYLVYMNHKGENTSEIMVTDIQMIFTLLLYIASILLIVYHAV